VSDWLKLLNFEVLNTAEFGLDAFVIKQGGFTSIANSLFSMAYGVKAVKRQYSLIPLTPVTQGKSKLATTTMYRVEAKSTKY
jgi:hypothetical protein